jgi:hypothetical protein
VSSESNAARYRWKLTVVAALGLKTRSAARGSSGNGRTAVIGFTAKSGVCGL